MSMYHPMYQRLMDNHGCLRLVLVPPGALRAFAERKGVRTPQGCKVYEGRTVVDPVIAPGDFSFDPTDPTSEEA